MRTPLLGEFLVGTAVSAGVGQSEEVLKPAVRVMRGAAIGIFLIALLAAVIAAAVLFTRRDKMPELEIALELPAQIARPDPLHYEPRRTGSTSRLPPSA